MTVEEGILILNRRLKSLNERLNDNYFQKTFEEITDQEFRKVNVERQQKHLLNLTKEIHETESMIKLLEQLKLLLY